MENYHGDYDELAEFVDALISRKYPNEPAENYKDLREKLIQELSDRIDEETFKGLDEDQIKDLEYVLGSKKETPDSYLDFFKRSGIDFRARVKDTMIEFGNEFLGGSNE